MDLMIIGSMMFSGVNWVQYEHDVLVLGAWEEIGMSLEVQNLHPITAQYALIPILKDGDRLLLDLS